MTIRQCIIKEKKNNSKNLSIHCDDVKNINTAQENRLNDESSSLARIELDITKIIQTENKNFIKNVFNIYILLYYSKFN